MKLIELSKKSSLHKGKYFAKVDDEDYEMLIKYNWNCHHDKNNLYATTTIRIGVNKRKTIQMHRLILGITDPKLRVTTKTIMD